MTTITKTTKTKTLAYICAELSEVPNFINLRYVKDYNGGKFTYCLSADEAKPFSVNSLEFAQTVQALCYEPEVCNIGVTPFLD